MTAGVAFDGRRCFLFARVAYDAGTEETLCFVVDLDAAPRERGDVSTGDARLAIGFDRR